MASARDAMETVAVGDPDVKIKALHGRSDDQRKQLETDLRATDQYSKSWVAQVANSSRQL